MGQHSRPCGAAFRHPQIIFKRPRERPSLLKIEIFGAAVARRTEQLGLPHPVFRELSLRKGQKLLRYALPARIPADIEFDDFRVFYRHESPQFGVDGDVEGVSRFAQPGMKVVYRPERQNLRGHKGGVGIMPPLVPQAHDASLVRRFRQPNCQH